MPFKKIIAYLSFAVPDRFLSLDYLFQRIETLANDPVTCDHKLYVVASIISTVELQVHCTGCNTYSEVPDPTKKEWADSYGAMENPYPWTDESRIRYYFKDGPVH